MSSQALRLSSGPLTVSGVQWLDGGQQESDELVANRVDPEAVLARERSRTAYERMGFTAAARLMRSALPRVAAQAPSGVGRLPVGVNLERYVSPTTAQVSLPAKRHGLVQSLTPIATRRSGGGYVPLKLGLHHTGHGFVTSGGDVKVSISTSLDQGATLEDGVSLVAVDGSGRALHGAGRLVGSAVFYSGSATDTDTAFKATTAGFEAYDLLRSARSPEELSFRIGVPRGASVKPVRGGSGAVRVVRAGRTIAVVPAASAVDASGSTVPVATTLSGRTLRLKVAHRGGDFAYPIAVDPAVIDSELTGSQTNWRLEKGGPGEGGNFWGFNEYSAGWVIYTDGTHQANQWGALLYPTQGESHIYEVSMESSAADSTANVENHMVIFGQQAGKEEPASWEARKGMATSYGRTSANACISQCTGGGSASNVAGYWVNALGTGTGGEARIYTASVYIEQANGPTASFDTTDATLGGYPNVLYGGGSWWGPHRGELKAIGKDPGVGVREILYEDGTLKWAKKSLKGCVIQCSELEGQLNGITVSEGTQHEALPNGESTLTIKAVNSMGMVSSAASTNVKVDGAAPTEVTISGLPSGNSLTDSTPSVKIVAKAKDGAGSTPSSGISSLKLSIDGKEVGSPSGSCSPGPCTDTGEWTIEADEYPTGSNGLVVTATDNAENTASAETTFTVHHASDMAMGPGQINPVTGEFDLEEADVSVATPNSSLRIARALDSREPTAGSEGPLGAPWTLTLGGVQSMVELANGNAMLVDVNGHKTVFTNLGGGSYQAPSGDASLTLSKSNEEFKLVRKGATVSFAHVSGDVEGLFRPKLSTGTSGTSSTFYAYQVVAGVTEPTEVLAPVPAGVSCSPELKPGCRSLTFNYATSTTATGEAPSQWGDYKGRLTRVYLNAYDPVSKLMKSTTVAQYAYDSKGTLRAEWDPRVSPALKTTYGYDTEGHLTSLSAPGAEPWLFTYGTSTKDTTAGRLVAFTRPTANTELGSGTAPAKTAIPALSGSPVVGTRMTVSDGTWSNTPLAYAYQWQRCSAAGAECQPIAGATNPNYTPVGGDAGHKLLASVTAINSGGAVKASSQPSLLVATTVEHSLPETVQQVDAGNSLNAVSCVPGTTTCVVSDSKGNAYYASNVSVSGPATWSSWTGPGTSPSEAVTCPTTSMCLLAAGTLGGYGGTLYYATSLGGSWTQAANLSYGVDAISCASSSFCVEGQDAFGYFRYSTNPASTSWTLEKQGSAVLKGVYCLSSSFCAIADGSGSVRVATTTAQIESSSWTETNVDGTTALNGIACTSTTSCVAVDSAGKVLNLAISGTGVAIATSKDIDGANSLTAVTCTTHSTCVTVDNQGSVFASINAGETWTERFQLGEALTSVSCSSASLCVTADTAGNVTAFNSTFVQQVDAGNSLNAVSCVPSTTTCVLSDSKGNAYYASNVSVSSPATWSSWTGPGTSPSEAVACPTTSECLMASGSASGYGGNLYYATSLGGAWSLAYAPTWGADAITCVSATFCLDGQDGSGGFRYSTNPPSTSWSVESQGTAAMKAVSCVSTSFCAIADGAGNVHVATTTTQIESSSWIETKVDGTTALNGIACTSTSSCVAVDGAGNVVKILIIGSTVIGSSQGIDGTNSLTAVTCTTNSTCVTVDNQGNVFVSTNSGSSWAKAYQLGDKLTSVSCASSSLCVTTDATGNVTSFTPAVGSAKAGELRSPTQRTTIEYGVPISGSGAPHQMTSTEVAKWAQTDVPAEATAVFPPDEPMGWPASDYRRAALYYLDGSDRLVNTASPTGGTTTDEYNSYGDVVRSLSASNRETALKEGAKSAEASQTLDTQRVYGSEGSELLETLAPTHTVKLANGTQVQARHHTVYSYDEGAPAGGPYRLVTKQTDGATISGQGEADVRTKKIAYSGQNGLGWILRAPTSETVDPSGLKLTHTTVYDPASGNVTETRTPGAGAPNEELLSGYIYRSTFGGLGSGNGQLSKPGAITRDASGNLWVADTANNRVEEFSSSGTFVQKFGTVGTGNGQLKSPKGIAVGLEGDVWVADTGNNRIEEFSGTGVYLSQFKSNAEHTELKGPTGLAVADNYYLGEMLVIADTGNNRVVEFTPQGSYYITVATSGTENGKVTKPEGVTVDSSGNVWIVDTGNNRIQEITDETIHFLQKFGTLGSGNGQLSKPEGLAVDSEGNVLVADAGNSRVEVFSSAGAYVAKFGTTGSGEQNMSAPAGVAVDASNDALVLDTGNSRVQTWAPAGNVHEGSGTGGTYGKQTIYYSTAANSQVPACGGHPEWAGLPCETKPAAQPETAGIPNLPVTTLTYDMGDEPLTSTETIGSTTRTTTDTYDEAERLTTVALSGTAGTGLPNMKLEYNAETGYLVKQSALIEGATKTVETSYDKRGNFLSYKDADGNTATYTYDVDGRPETANDGKGTQTYSYDTTTGLLTKLIDSAAGTFTATYDAEGDLLTAGYPNGMNVNHTFNSDGDEVGVEYVKTTNCSSNCTWYSETETPSIHGQALSQSSTFSSQAFTYDEAGRLTKAQDTPAGSGCTTRIYGYDVETNITSLTTRSPNGEGQCASEGGTVVNHSYDTASRLTDSGIAYNPFGDITWLPAGDAGGTSLSSSYYVDNTLASQTQNSQTIGYSLDPLGRTRQTVSTGTVNSTVTSHYAEDGRTVAWSEDTSGKWTRLIQGLEGLVAVQSNGEAPVLQIKDLHGSVVATASLSETAGALLTKNDTTEYGVPRTSSPPKYSWQGAESLATELPSGIVAMGARSYVPQIARFLQPDPVEGGSANAYAYTYGDPVGTHDPSGEYMVEMPEWVHEFLDERAEVATEEAIERAAAEQAAREEAEEKAREAAEEAAEAAAEAAVEAAEAAAEAPVSYGGKGKKGKGKGKAKAPKAKAAPRVLLMTDPGGGCSGPGPYKCGAKPGTGTKPIKAKEKSKKCGSIMGSYHPRGSTFGLNSGVYYGGGKVQDACVEPPGPGFDIPYCEVGLCGEGGALESYLGSDPQDERRAA